MDKMVNETEGKSDISLICRKEMTVSGVVDVKAFDEQEVVADTVQGILLVKGNALSVDTLSTEKGILKITGRVDALIYNKKTGQAQKKPVLKRIFS